MVVFLLMATTLIKIQPQAVLPRSFVTTCYRLDSLLDGTALHPRIHARRRNHALRVKAAACNVTVRPVSFEKLALARRPTV